MSRGRENASILNIEFLNYVNDLVDILNKKPMLSVRVLEDITHRVMQDYWGASSFSNIGHAHNVPVDRYRLYKNYIESQYEKSVTVTDYISLKWEAAMGTTSVASADQYNDYVQERFIDVPEGYDGNYSFVEFFVPSGVVYDLREWQIGGALGAYPSAFCSPFVDNDLSNPLAFYSYYAGKGDLFLKDVKQKDVVIIKSGSPGCTWAEPFDTSLIPRVNIKITFFKKGLNG